MGDLNVVGTLIKVAITFGLLFVTLRVVGRLNGSRPRLGSGGGRGARVERPVELVARSSLGRSASVAIVRLGQRCFALGVTDQHINLIAEVEIDLSTPEPAGTQAPETRPSWRDLVENLRDRTVRH